MIFTWNFSGPKQWRASLWLDPARMDALPATCGWHLTPTGGARSARAGCARRAEAREQRGAEMMGALLRSNAKKAGSSGKRSPSAPRFASDRASGADRFGGDNHGDRSAFVSLATGGRHFAASTFELAQFGTGNSATEDADPAFCTDCAPAFRKQHVAPATLVRAALLSPHAAPFARGATITIPSTIRRQHDLHSSGRRLGVFPYSRVSGVLS